MSQDVGEYADEPAQDRYSLAAEPKQTQKLFPDSFYRQQQADSLPKGQCRVAVVRTTSADSMIEMQSIEHSQLTLSSDTYRT